MMAIRTFIKEKKWWIVSFVAVIAIIAVIYVLTLQNEQPTFIESGKDFTVTVYAKEVSNLYGYQFNLFYDYDKATYKGELKSSIDAISMIFKKDMEDHLLVGATMIGDVPGFSAKNVEVCTMKFTANSDIDSSIFTLNGVNTVDADQEYLEDISGWSIKVSVD